MKLNLSCGVDYKDPKEWVNTDISKEVKADKYFDVRDKFPLDSDSFDEIYASGIMEQILTNEDFLHTMNECWRVLKKGCLMNIVVPNAKRELANRDPFDVRKFTEETFQYFDSTNRFYKMYGRVYGFKPWHLLKIFTNESGIITASLIK